MKTNFDFFKTTMPGSRKADYYLGCLDGSVYLDFNITADNCIDLCRISFDGFGCCNINEAKSLDKQSSKYFLEALKKDNLDQEIITEYVLKLIQLNKDKIWTDALEKYNFIDSKK